MSGGGVSFGREKRLWLGFLALVAPIPLPLNQVLEWPFLFVYALFVIAFLQRAERGAWTTLSNWALNLLGLVYLPIFLFDLRATFLRSSAVTALLHLILFLVVVKLYSIRREKDKWHLMASIFFLFIGAMATSSHVTIGLYLLGFMALAMLALGRFAFLHVAAGAGEETAPAVPFRAPLAFGILTVLLVAIPLFATMPRVREPYILGRGTGNVGMARTTGFSDSVDLSLTSAIRANRNVALRLRYDEPLANPGEARFKGAAYDRYDNRKWFRSQDMDILTQSRRRTFALAEGEPVRSAEVFLEPLDSVSLVLPVETLTVKLDRLLTVGLDPGGAVVLPGLPRRETLRYEVELAAEPVIAAQHDTERVTTLDTRGVTPRMRELARRVMGVGTDGEKADRLERHLASEYAYTDDFVGRDGENPLEDFLFTYKSGHCEYFASAMVLMLRQAGIPARFVTGFLGAEFNPLESYYMVRQQNAHAWVEAYTPERGWRVYDPTPPEGRPSISPQSLALFFSQLYDYVNFRWDRYVLTYGAEDQESFFRRWRERVEDWWQRVKGWTEGEEAQPEPVAQTGEIAVHEPADAPSVWQPSLPLGVLLGVFIAAVGSLWWWNRRRPLTGADAYRRLRARLDRSDVDVPESLAPLALQRRLAARYPRAAAAGRRLVGLYLRESFAGEALTEPQRNDLRQALAGVEEALKAARRQERKAA